jgi:hypothetical protein
MALAFGAGGQDRGHGPLSMQIGVKLDAAWCRRWPTGSNHLTWMECPSRVLRFQEEELSNDQVGNGRRLAEEDGIFRGAKMS